MTYSYSDFVDSVLGALRVTVPEESADSPRGKADLALAEIGRLHSLLEEAADALAEIIPQHIYDDDEPRDAPERLLEQELRQAARGPAPSSVPAPLTEYSVTVNYRTLSGGNSRTVIVNARSEDEAITLASACVRQRRGVMTIDGGTVTEAFPRETGEAAP